MRGKLTEGKLQSGFFLVSTKCKAAILYFQDEDLAMIAAQQYYIDYGPDMILERLQSLLPSYIPDSCLQGGKSLNYWMQGVVNGHKKSYFVRDRVPPLKVLCLFHMPSVSIVGEHK